MKILLFLFCAFMSLDTLAAPKTEIVIGFNPAENSEAVETNGRLFSAYFQKHLGISVKTFVSSDYTALIEAMRSNKVDFGFLPPFSLVKAEEIAEAKVLMKAQRHGQVVFYSAIIVKTGRGLNKIEDLAGKNIAWVDPASASGFIIPKAALMTKKKINPEKFFGKQVFAGAHDAVVMSVLNGTVDAGATFVNDLKGEDGAWHLFLKKEEDRNKIKMIFISDPIPNEAMATTKKFESENTELVKKVVSLLAKMGKDPEGLKILKVLYNIDLMVPATAKEYNPVRAAAKLLGIE